MKPKTFSDPQRRFHRDGGSTVIVDGKRLRCYEGWFLRERDPETGRRRWLFAGETLEQARAGTRMATGLRIRTFEGISGRPRSGAGVRVPASQVAMDVRRGAGA